MKVCNIDSFLEKLHNAVALPGDPVALHFSVNSDS
jgi:hypothetical protein